MTESHTVQSKIIAFSLASLSFVSINKVATKDYPHLDVLILFQSSFTVLAIALYDRCSASERKLPVSSNARLWMPCAFAYCISCFTSLQAMQNVSMQTFLVFNSLSIALTAGLERVTMNKTFDLDSICALLIVATGSVVYAWQDLQCSTLGYCWCLAHIAAMAIYSILVKQKSRDATLSVKDMALYNNLVPIPAILLLLVAQSRDLSLQLAGPFFSDETAPILWTSAFLACATSVTALRAQTSLSPTAFILLNTVHALPSLLLRHLVSPAPAPLPTAGLSLSILGAYLYSRVGAHSPVLAQPQQASSPALPASSPRPGLLKARSLRSMLAATAFLAIAAAAALSFSAAGLAAQPSASRRALQAALRSASSSPPPRLKYDRALCTGLGDRLSVLLAVAAVARVAGTECYVYWCERDEERGGGGGGGDEKGGERGMCRRRD